MKKINIVSVMATSCCFGAYFSSYDLHADDLHQDKKAVEVIEVTAQKHQQKIEDIAISVTVVTNRTIVEQNLKDTAALSAQSPNFKITRNGGEGTPPAVNIRGVGSFDTNTSTTSPVGIYLDNVAGGSANAHVINLFDIESIEILRGPQGTLFGRNTTAGTLLLRSQRPEDEFGGYLTAGFAEQQDRKLEGAVNLPVNEHVASRLAFSLRDYNYSTTNLYPLAPEAGMRQQLWRLSVLGQWQDFEVFAKVHQEEWDGTVQPFGHIPVVKSRDPQTGAATALCSPAQAGSLSCTDNFGFNDGSTQFHDIAVDNNINGNSPHLSDSWGADIHFKLQLNDQYHLESTSSYNTLDRLHFFNCDASTNNFCAGSHDTETDVFTQEIRLHAQLKDLYLIGGLYYLDETIIQDNMLDVFRDFRTSPTAFGAATTRFYDNNIDIRALAIFGHSEYKITDQTTLTAGLRYSDESTDYRAIGHFNTPQAVNDQVGVNSLDWDIRGKVKDDNLSGKIALNHKFSDTFSAFASYSRGFKSGGYNGATLFAAALAQRSEYGSETLDAYELGSRFNWDDANARLNLTTFYYDYRDQQVFMNQQAIDPTAPPLQLLDNVGKSVIYGVEADLSWQLTPAFKATFSLGYLPEANLEQFVNEAGVEINDNRLPFTSKWNGSGLAEYVVSLSDAELVFQLNFDHQSEFYFDQNENPYTQQQSYTLYNMRIAYEQQNWTLALWGKNITDKHYSHFKFDLIGFLGMLQDNRGEARQFGIDVNYAF